VIPLILLGSLVAMSALCALLARALRERNIARVSLGIARMEVLDLRTRLQDTHRRVVELERQADRPQEIASSTAHIPTFGRSIPGGAR
jgi:hypothetical protein